MRLAAAMRLVADYTVGTAIVLAHLVIVGFEQRRRAELLLRA
jgi:hypothetical protein